MYSRITIHITIYKYNTNLFKLIIIKVFRFARASVRRIADFEDKKRKDSGSMWVCI